MFKTAKGRLLAIVLVAALVLLLLTLTGTKAQAQALSFGIVPQQSAKTMAAKWGPVLRYLSAESGVELKFATAKNIPIFEQRLGQSRYDIAYMNPYHFVVFHESPGYQALAKQRDKQIRGILVVPKDSPITGIEDLQGKILAFPAPAAFAASIIPRGELGNGGIQFTAKYVSSHDSVYLTVSKGLFAAGGGVMRTFNNTAESVRKNLRILWKTQPYTPHAFATRPGLDPEIAEKLMAAMLVMNQSQEGLQLLKAINFKGFTPASADDWDDVRALGLNTLTQPGT